MPKKVKEKKVLKGWYIDENNTPREIIVDSDEEVSYKIKFSPDQMEEAIKYKEQHFQGWRIDENNSPVEVYSDSEGVVDTSVQYQPHQRKEMEHHKSRIKLAEVETVKHKNTCYGGMLSQDMLVVMVANGVMDLDTDYSGDGITPRQALDSMGMTDIILEKVERLKKK